MKKRIFVYCILLPMILTFSCVSSKKYKAAVADADQLKAANTDLMNKNTDLTNKNTDLQKQVTDLNNAGKALSQQYVSYQQKCEDDRKKLVVVTAIVKKQYDDLQEVEKKIETAEADFKDKGVDVYYKDGLVYVSMEDKLMYKTGSSKLDANAKQALSNLANVLNDYPNLKVIVLGHTDNVQFKNGGDNWSLSTERANGVVRCLRDDGKVDPVRLTSAGKGKYAPVADNTSAEGRAKNRRTDIILNPDLERLWEEAKNSN